MDAKSTRRIIIRICTAILMSISSCTWSAQTTLVVATRHAPAIRTFCS